MQLLIEGSPDITISNFRNLVAEFLHVVRVIVGLSQATKLYRQKYLEWSFNV